MTTFDKLANATLRICTGNSSGSGFHFIDKQIIVTNYHVIELSIRNPAIPIIGFTESGKSYRLQVVSYSDQFVYDFAILHAIDDVDSSRTVLQPKIFDKIPRGLEVLFSGFPHGIPHLLVHKAIISGYPDGKSFYIDGSVNGGNSGGPIIDKADLSVVGIVTQRRFIQGADLSAMASEAQRLNSHCKQIKGGGSVNIMGIDFASFAEMIGHSLEISSAIIEANANSGIGVGFNIKFVKTAYDLININHKHTN